MKQISKSLAISSKQLSQDLTQQKPLLLFDLRTVEQFEKSHIQGSVHAVCDTQAKEKIMPKIPKNTKIVLISEPEEISKETAHMMDEFGLEAFYLNEGFSSWKGNLSKGKTGKIISVEQLAEKLDQVTLLDVRNKDEFSDYQIPESMNIPLDELFDSKTVETIPKDKKIVTICPHGNRSMIASYALERAGIDSLNLEGGLESWNQFLMPVTIASSPVKIIQLQKIGKGCLSHIIESSGEAIVIDPLYPFEKYLEIANNQGFKITKIFDTHQHADHVSSARDLSKEVDAKLYLSKYEGYDFDANLIGDGDKIPFGNTTLRVIHTPGHTPGSLCYVIDEKYVFTGDILFVDSIGRPDLRDQAEEFAEKLYDSLHNKLQKLPHYTMFLPTHYGGKINPENKGFYSTIQESGKLDWFDFSKQKFIKKIVDLSLPRPVNYRKIIRVNKGELDLIHSEIPDLEIGPNRCAANAS